IEGQQLAYLDKGEGPVLLFGHSYLWDSQMWAPQVEVLSQSFRCIVPDLWAHGESDAAPASTQSLADYAQHMLALMDHLDIEEFSIVGLSVGGMWGAELTAQAPQRVKSLVLMDTFIGWEP
ncbi:alpha/beta fold hydrolase, partial [Vibrio parahaemolyticus]